MLVSSTEGTWPSGESNHRSSFDFTIDLKPSEAPAFGGFSLRRPGSQS